MTWRRVAIKQVCKVVGGGTPSSGVEKYWGGDIVWVTPTDLGNSESRYILTSARTITKDGYDACGAEILPPGSVVMSSRAPIGHLGIAKSELCTNQGCKSFICGSSIDPEFLYYALRFSMPAIRALGSGATFAEVSKSQLEDFEIAIPPLSEQQRIAATLNEQMVATRKATALAQSLLDSARSLFDSHLRQCFESPTSDDWPRRHLEDLVPSEEAITDGPFGSHLKTEHYQTSGVRVVRLQNIGRGEFLDTDKAYVSQGHFIKLGKHAVMPNDILVAALGNGRRPAGRACLVPAMFGLGLVKADCFRVRVDPTEVMPEFVMAFFNAPRSLRAVNAAMRGATRPRVTLAMIRETVIPTPTLEEQSAVVLRLREAFSLSKQLIEKAQSIGKDISVIPETLLRRAFAEDFLIRA